MTRETPHLPPAHEDVAKLTPEPNLRNLVTERIPLTLSSPAPSVDAASPARTRFDARGVTVVQTFRRASAIPHVGCGGYCPTRRERPADVRMSAAARRRRE
jgi:hypothetical protein